MRARALSVVLSVIAACGRTAVPNDGNDGFATADTSAVESRDVIRADARTLDAFIQPDRPPPDTADVVEEPLAPGCSTLGGVPRLVLPDDAVTTNVNHIVDVAGSSCFALGREVDAGAMLAEAPGDAYSLHLGERSGVVVSIVPERGDAMAVLSIRSACGAETELRCMTRAHDNQATLATVLDAGDYVVVATGMPAGARYRIVVHGFAAPENLSCETGLAITGETTVVNQRLSSTSPRIDCPNALAGAVHYVVTVPAGETALLSAIARSAPGFSPAFLWWDTCDESCGTISGPGLEIPNPGTGSRIVHVAIGASGWAYDRNRSVQAGRFDLQVLMRPIPENRSIETATRVTNGSHFEDEPLGSGGETSLCASPYASYGRWRFYRATLEADQTAIVRTHNSLVPAWDAYTTDPSVVMLDPETHECLTTTNSRLHGAPVVSFQNGGGAARDVIIAVGKTANAGEVPTGRFDLAIEFASPPPNDQCGAATPIAPNAIVPITAALAARPTPLCTQPPAPRAFYAIEIPPGQMPDRRSLGWRDDIAFGTCEPECTRAPAINQGTTPRTALLVRSATSSRDWYDAPDDSRVRFRSAPRDVEPADTCERAVPFTPGETVRVDLSGDAWRWRNTYFRTEIPPHTWFRIQHSGGESLMDLLDGCGGVLWTSRGSTPGDSLPRPNWMEFGNTADVPRSVVIAARFDRGSAGILFTTDLVGRAGFGTHIDTDCEDMSMATLMDRTWPLPFAFEYRGEPMASIGVGGRLVRADGTVGAIVAVPGATGPWVQTFGTAPNRHVTVQGRGYYPVQGHSDGPSLPTGYFTAQVKYFEATNAIEFHYCSFTLYRPSGWNFPAVLSGRFPRTGVGTSSYLSDGDGSHASVRWRGNTNLGVDFGAVRFLPADE